MALLFLEQRLLPGSFSAQHKQLAVIPCFGISCVHDASEQAGGWLRSLTIALGESANMNEERQSPFTGPGKALFLVSVGIGCVGFYWVFVHLLPNLPSGSYPIFYLLGPVVIAAVLFFFGMAAILRRRGVAVFVSEREEVERMRRGFEAKEQETKK